MQAKIYSPTIEQRAKGLKVAERFWTKSLLVRLAIYAAVPLVLAWYDADFGFPFTPDRGDVVVGIISAFVGEIIAFHNKKTRAEGQVEDQEEGSKVLGPIRYRLSEAGLESWGDGARQLDDWGRFGKFKLTDDLLIVVLSGRRGGYWVFPRDEIGEPLLSIVLGKLEESGAKRVVAQE